MTKTESTLAELGRYVDQLEAELRPMTGKRLREYARTNRVPLAGVSRKSDLRREILAQMRSRKLTELLDAAADEMRREVCQ